MIAICFYCELALKLSKPTQTEQEFNQGTIEYTLSFYKKVFLRTKTFFFSRLSIISSRLSYLNFLVQIFCACTLMESEKVPSTLEMMIKLNK